MELAIIRRFFNEKYTIGRFLNEDTSLCDTLEDPVRDLKDINHDGDFDDPGEGKIYGQTAIPYGRYRVKLTYSPKLKRVLPILLDVPGFSGVRIHSGIDEKTTLGCPQVGENKIKGKLINGPHWETIIINLIREAIDRKEEVYLTIKM